MAKAKVSRGIARGMVYKAIDSERNYQLKRWGVNGEDAKHSVGDFLTYMDDYLSEAKHRASREDGDTGSLEVLRKVVALGVACMEQHGAPMRADQPVQSGRTKCMPGSR